MQKIEIIERRIYVDDVPTQFRWSEELEMDMFYEKSEDYFKSEILYTFKQILKEIPFTPETKAGIMLELMIYFNKLNVSSEERIKAIELMTEEFKRY